MVAVAGGILPVIPPHSHREGRKPAAGLVRFSPTWPVGQRERARGLRQADRPLRRIENDIPSNVVGVANITKMTQKAPRGIIARRAESRPGDLSMPDPMEYSFRCRNCGKGIENDERMWSVNIHCETMEDRAITVHEADCYNYVFCESCALCHDFRNIEIPLVD